ncbi:MAG: nuclear transport factor 2 family protein [Solirubrobacteraceae bacterium]
MSQENVELVRDLCDSFVAGDLETALGGLDDDIVWHGTVGGLDEGRVAHGHAEVIEAFRENLRDWESHSLEALRYFDAGDRVVVLWHEEGRGRASGAQVTSDTAAIYTVRRGHVVHVQGYMKRADALKAVGLAE